MKYANKPERGMLIRWVDECVHVGMVLWVDGLHLSVIVRNKAVADTDLKNAEVRWPDDADTAWRPVFEKEPEEREIKVLAWVNENGLHGTIARTDMCIANSTPLIVAAKGDRIVAVRLANPAEPSGNAGQLSVVNPPNVKRETRYDWSKAPAWAKFVTVDKNGECYWFSEDPANFTYARVFTENHDWRESLEARPVSP